MPGINTTGKPNTSDYILGRGIVYLAELSNDLPVNFRDVGNATEFNMTVEVETRDHQSSRAGLRVTDKEVVLSQKVNISLTLDEISFNNLAEFFAGETASYDNPAADVQAKHALVAGVALGRWYELKDSSGNRVYGITSTNALVVTNESAVGTPALTLGTDYEINAAEGMIFFPTTATDAEGGVAGSLSGEDIGVSWSADGSLPLDSVDEVRGLTQSSKTVAMKFIGENPAANDGKFEVQIHKISLKAEGDLAFIGDDWATMQFTGVAESNATASADSPFFTIRNLVA